MANCCESMNDACFKVERSEDGKLILTIDPSKLPAAGEKKEGAAVKCCCC